MKTFKEFLEVREGMFGPGTPDDPSDYDHGIDMHGDRSWRRDDNESSYSKPTKPTKPTKDRKQLIQEIIRMIGTKGHTELEKIHAFITYH